MCSIKGVISESYISVCHEINPRRCRENISTGCIHNMLIINNMEEVGVAYFVSIGNDYYISLFATLD